MPIPNMNQVYQSIGNEADAVRNKSIKAAGNKLFRVILFGLGLLWMATSHCETPQEVANMSIGKVQEEWLANLAEGERIAYGNAMICAICIAPPVGRWTLLRKGKDLCAVRFTAFHRAHPKDKSIRENQESFFANYDWVYQGDGSGKFSKPNVKSGHSQADKKPNIWRFPRGSNYIECGPLKATWTYPNGIALIARDFHPEKTNRSNDIEIAPTGWMEITQVNSQDPRLAWHRYDPVRDLGRIQDEAIIIPVERLPRYKPGW